MKRTIIIIVTLLVLAGGYFGLQAFQQRRLAAQTLANMQTETAQTGTLTATVGATGTVRSSQSAALLWQTSGTVDAVSVSAGQPVAAGEVLASLAQTSLPQNVILAQADLVNALRALDDLLNSPLRQAQALKAVEDAEHALEDALNPELQQALALQDIADAEKAVNDAQRLLNIATTPADQASIDAAKAQVILAKNALERAQEQFDPWAGKPEDNLIRANLQANLSAARQKYDAAVRELNALLGTGSPLDIAVARADLVAAQAQLSQVRRDYDRIKDGPSPAQIALFEAQLVDARRAYERIQDGPDPADVAAAEARVAAAQATLETAFIKAPFAGVVSEILAKPGDQTSPGTRAFRLDDLSRLLIDVEVSEVDINRIAAGQPATLSFDAAVDREYHGVVTDVALFGTTVQGVVSFKVTIELTDADENVRPGMTAGVNIVVQELEDVLLVPNRAVRVLEGERVVFVIRADSPAPVPVTVELGVSSDTHSQVLGGELQVGDVVVLNPPSDFSFFEGPPGGGGPQGP